MLATVTQRPTCLHGVVLSQPCGQCDDQTCVTPECGQQRASIGELCQECRDKRDEEEHEQRLAAAAALGKFLCSFCCEAFADTDGGMCVTCTLETRAEELQALRQDGMSVVRDLRAVHLRIGQCSRDPHCVPCRSDNCDAHKRCATCHHLGRVELALDEAAAACRSLADAACKESV